MPSITDYGFSLNRKSIESQKAIINPTTPNVLPATVTENLPLAQVNTYIPNGGIDMSKVLWDKLFVCQGMDSNKRPTGRGYLELNAVDTNTPFLKVYDASGNTQVVLGQLKDKTGVDEFGLWVRGIALYLGGYKQYDIMATKEGTAGATLVYYNGGEYASIKAALDAAQTNSETDVTVFVRAGTYAENENTTGWNMDVRIIGEDKDKSIISFAASQKLWRFNKNLYLSNLSFTANAGSNALIYAEGSDYVYIENCEIENLYSHANGAGGIRIGACTDLTDTGVIIKNCDIRGVSALTNNPTGTYAGICISGDRGNLKLIQNDIQTSGFGIWLAGTTNQIRNLIVQNRIGIISDDTLVRGSGIYINSSSFAQSLIEGNSIFQNSGTGYYPKGIFFDGDASTFQNNRVVNNFVIAASIGIDLCSAGIVCGGNQVQGCEEHGILVSGGNNTATNINNIVNNSVYNCGEDGISIEVSNFNIVGNSVYNCAIGIGDSETTAIHENVICSSNAIRNCDNGILIQCSNGAYASNNFVFSNNYISGDSDQTSGIGIGLGSYMNKIIIEGNIIRKFSNGIGLSQRAASDCVDVTIANNDIQDMNSHAINFDGQNVSPVRIVNNNAKEGILLEYLYTGVISNNYISGANGIAIDVSMSNSEISGNYIDVTTNNGILVTDDVLDGSRIINNYIDTQAEGAVGIKIDDDMSDTLIRGNRIDSEIIGIRIGGDMFTSIIDNNWIQYDAAGYGIQVIGNVDTSTSNTQGTVINGNTIQHDDTTGATECIYIGGTARNLVVTGNRLYGGGAGDYVITIVGTTHYCLFTGNRNSEGLAAGSIGSGIQGTGARTGNVEASNLLT